MKDNELTIIGEIDLAQFERKPNKYKGPEDNLSLSSEESSSIMTKDQEIEVAYREYYQPLEDEWKKYSEQCKRAREIEMKIKAEQDEIEQENKLKLMHEKAEEELLERLQEEEEEREKRCGTTKVYRNNNDPESEIIGALINGYGDSYGFD